MQLVQGTAAAPQADCCGAQAPPQQSCYLPACQPATQPDNACTSACESTPATAMTMHQWQPHALQVASTAAPCPHKQCSPPAALAAAFMGRDGAVAWHPITLHLAWLAGPPAPCGRPPGGCHAPAPAQARHTLPGTPAACQVPGNLPGTPAPCQVPGTHTGARHPHRRHFRSCTPSFMRPAP